MTSHNGISWIYSSVNKITLRKNWFGKIKILINHDSAFRDHHLFYKSKNEDYKEVLNFFSNPEKKKRSVRHQLINIEFSCRKSLFSGLILQIKDKGVFRDAVIDDVILFRKIFKGS